VTQLQQLDVPLFFFLAPCVNNRADSSLSAEAENQTDGQTGVALDDTGRPAIGYAVLTPVVPPDSHWSFEIEVKSTTSSTKYGLHIYPYA